MKHFVIEVTYTAPLEKIDLILQAHRAFLQRGYDQGTFLCSGPQTPRVGGIIIARASSLEDLKAFCAHDPFLKQNVATYQFKEFTPVKRQAFLDAWVNE